MSTEYFEANRANWDERADIHIKDETGFYAIDRLIAGEPVLTPIERAELPVLTGKRVAHLQCHIGTDTLSLKLLGAREVAGLDFSPRAVAHARQLAERAGLEARFVEGSVYDAGELLGPNHDLVFTSWGTIGWLDDIERWAAAIASVLRPGGQFYFADSHPFALPFESGPAGGPVLTYDYVSPKDEPLSFDEDTTYNLSDDKIRSTRTYEWTHSMSRVLNALLGVGLKLSFVHEHEEVPWRMFGNLVEGSPRMWRLPPGHVRLPLAWSILAEKS